jgi:four helix bundle protein
MNDLSKFSRRPSPIREKSFVFAIRILKLSRFLQETKREYVLSKQIMRSGTSIGALVREAEQAESTPDFIHKLAIALKEAHETDYWIELLHETRLIELGGYNSIKQADTELIRILTSIIKTTRKSR